MMFPKIAAFSFPTLLGVLALGSTLWAADPAKPAAPKAASPNTEAAKAAPAAKPAAPAAAPAKADAPKAADTVKEVRLYALDCGKVEFKDMGFFSDTGEYDGKPGTVATP